MPRALIVNVNAHGSARNEPKAAPNIWENSGLSNSQRIMLRARGANPFASAMTLA
jgi:hypothetical protein